MKARSFIKACTIFFCLSFFITHSALAAKYAEEIKNAITRIPTSILTTQSVFDVASETLPILHETLRELSERSCTRTPVIIRLCKDHASIEIAQITGTIDYAIIIGIHDQALIFSPELTDQAVRCILAHEKCHTNLDHSRNMISLVNTFSRLVKLFGVAWAALGVYDAPDKMSFALLFFTYLKTIPSPNIINAIAAPLVKALIGRQYELDADAYGALITSREIGKEALLVLKTSNLRRYEHDLKAHRDAYEKENYSTSLCMLAPFVQLEHSVSQDGSERHGFIDKQKSGCTRTINRIRKGYHIACAAHPRLDQRLEVIDRPHRPSRCYRFTVGALTVARTLFWIIGIPVSTAE